MVDKIRSEVIEIYKKLEGSGFQVYLVGGCVRDLLLEREIKDWDLTTDATPEQIQDIFPHSFYDNTFGTVGIPYETTLEIESEQKNCPPAGRQVLEVTTFRTEHGYIDRRHPERVTWGRTIEEDLSRRDFTMNAIAIKLSTVNDQLSIVFVDPYHGVFDIEKKLIRAVRNPDERFKEDALRLARAIRFSAQLEFEIEQQTWNSITIDANLISHISGERIRDELFKILESNKYYEGMVKLDQAGILDIIFPELARGKGVSMIRPGRHHTTDVFNHNMLSLKECPSKDPLVRFATLLHDVGKPFVATTDESGHIIFYNHEVAGAKIAYEICERLRLSKKERDKVVTLIRWHMFTVDENITDSAVRRFIRRVGLENVKDIIDLRIGDRLGSGTKTAESWRLKQFKERIEQQLHPPFSINDLAVDGNDVMRELSIKPGPKVGEILQKLFEEVDEDLSKNDREYLLRRINDFRN